MNIPKYCENHGCERESTTAIIIPSHRREDGTLEICPTPRFMCAHDAAKYLSDAIKKIPIREFVARKYDRLSMDEIYANLSTSPINDENNVINRLGIDPQ